MSASEVKKRLYVGGLAKDVTEDELKKKFEIFLTVSSISVKSQTDSEGNHVKTFAHLDVQGTEPGLKKCYNAYQNAKWRGSLMKLEDAKESFLDRLAAEREDEKNKLLNPGHAKKKKKKVEDMKPPEIDKLNVAPVPGTPIPGKKDWVVGKYGRVLPVLNVKKSHVTKAVKHDPSKFCHASKVFKEDNTDMSKVNCDTLTWEIDEPDSEITKKRKGEFPPDPKPKKVKPFPVELLKSPVKEKFSSKTFTKESASNKSFSKENFSKNHKHNDSGSPKSDDDENFELSGKNDDGLEIVKVGGSMEKKNDPKVRSRFDSDYESDGGDNDTESSHINNNKTNSLPVKSSKKTNNKKVSCAKKSKPASSDEEESESATEISEFKGIGSLITKLVDISPNKKNSMKNKASDHAEKTVCNGKLNTDGDVKKNNDKVISSSKQKGKRKSQESEIFSLKNVKKSVNEGKLPFKPNPISTLQKDSSQCADPFLSEFVAIAPKKQQSRQKYDPYDSDLDSNNFELVAKKLAKKAGVEMARENKKKVKKSDLNVSVNNFSKNGSFSGSKTDKNITKGVENLMLSLAGYSADGNTETCNAGSKQDKGSDIKCLLVKEQIPQRKDLIKSAPKNEDRSSFKKTVVNSNVAEDSSSDEDEVENNKGKDVAEDSSSDEDEVENSKGKDVSEDSSSDEDEVENSKGKDVSEDSSSDKVENSKEKDVAEDSSSDEDEVENSKGKDVTEDSSSDESEDEVKDSHVDGLGDAKGKPKVGIKAVSSKDTKDKASIKHEVFSSSSSSSDEEEEEEEKTEVEEISLAEENKRNLQVLENVVGKNKVDKLTAKLKRDNVKIMDMNQLRFDPTKFKLKQTQQKKPEVISPEKSVKKEENLKIEMLSPKEFPTKDKTPKQEKKLKKESVGDSAGKSEVTMSDSMMTMLKSESQVGGNVKEKAGESFSFSLLDLFDGPKHNNKGEAMETEIDLKSPAKPLSGLQSLPKLRDNKDNPLNKKMVPKDDINDNETVNTKQKNSKDKAMMKDAVAHKDNSEKKKLKIPQQKLNKVLNDAGRVDVRFTKAEWRQRNNQIRHDMLKICRNRNNYAVRKKRIEEGREKEKTVRKFGSWKKK